MVDFFKKYEKLVLTFFYFALYLISSLQKEKCFENCFFGSSDTGSPQVIT